MKRLITLVILLVGLTPLVNAQTAGGPDTYGYVWRNSNDAAGPVYGWVDLTAKPTAVQVTGLGDDNTVGPFLLPTGMTFHYYWYDINKFWVGSNGYIMFNNGQISSPFPVMPATTLPNDYIAGLMSDLTYNDNAVPANPIPSAKVFYWTNNSQDTLVVEWLTVPFWQSASPGYTGTNSFEIVLSRVDSSITVNFQNQTGLTQNGDMATGIENNSGSIGLCPIYDPLTTPYVPASFSIKYYYPSGTTFTVNDAASEWADNATNGGLFLSKGGAPFMMNAKVTNPGNVSLPTFNVNTKVIGPSPSVAIKAQDNLTVGPLTPGQSQPVAMTTTFNPLNAGVYRYFSLTQYPGDAFIGNDSARVEIHVVDTTQQSILLTFDNGIHSGDPTGLSWSGGNGGAGMYFIPPYYPCEIDTLRYFIIANPGAVGFTASIIDDDGPGGAGLTELFNLPVTAADVDTLSWTYVVVNPPVTITSGGFYVAWTMDGDGISLGQDRSAPISNRTYEILGTTWAIYRSRETEDLMINAIVKGNFGAGVEEKLKSDDLVAGIYPNPVKNKMSVHFNNPGTDAIKMEIFTLQGVRLFSESVSAASGSATLDVTTLPSGVYTLKTTSKTATGTEKFVVIK